MNLTVQRENDDGQSMTGQLFIDGIFECWTLEPSASRATYPAIPSGTYPIELLDSPRFGCVTPHIQNVPSRSFIEIHPGNRPQDTEGCTLVGETQAIDWVGSSRIAFLKLMATLTTAKDNLEITYVDPTPRNVSVGVSGD